MHVAASTGRMVAGRYLLRSTIGRGAMGTVWRARDTVLDRDVAVKEVRLRGPVTTGSVMTEETRILYERTLREARTAARLNHPAVVTIFDVVEADGSPWIVMELVEARSLDQVLTEDGPLRPDQAADLGMRVLGALACAHAAGILHRDVKPSNVLLGPDRRAVLTDFGIATLEGDSGLTQAGMVMGTPGFTAPERIRGDPASPASDLWSLGATLYAAVDGRGPFDDRGNSIAILAAIANEEAPRPRQAGPLRPVIEALLHRNPQARPDASGVGRLLAAASTRTGGGTRPGTSPSGDAARPATRAGAPLLTAPLRLPGPQTQAPDGTLPDGQPADGQPPDGQWAELLTPQSPGPGPWAADRPQPGDAPWASPAPEPGGPPSASPPSASPPSASPQVSRALTGQAGRHGAAAPGLRRGLAAEFAALLPRGRRGLLVLLGALVIVGAGIVAGIALTHGGSGGGAPAGGTSSPAWNDGRAGRGGQPSRPRGWLHHDGSAGLAESPAGRQHRLHQPGGRPVDPGHPRRRRRDRPGGAAPAAGPGRGARQLPRLPAGRPPAVHLPRRGRPGLAVHLAARQRGPDGGPGNRVPARHRGRPPGLPDPGIGTRSHVGSGPAAVPAGAEHVPGPLMTLAAARLPGRPPAPQRRGRVSTPCRSRPGGRTRLRGCCSWSRTG